MDCDFFIKNETSHFGINVRKSKNYYDTATKYINSDRSEYFYQAQCAIWLLFKFCIPVTDIPKDMVGQILSILFNWFHTTAHIYDGKLKCSM